MVTTNYTDVFSGNLVGPAFPQYSAITLSSNIDLAWPTDFQNLNMVVSLIMDISPTVDDEYQITLPDATKAGTGFVFKINNPSGHDFDLLDNTGEHLTTINGGEAQEIWLVGNTTSAGSWRFLPMSGGSAVTYVDATSSTDNLTIAGVPIIGAGTIAFTLAKDLLALSTFESATGFSARTAVNTWALRTITGTSGSINVTAGDGVSGNPTIALNPNISITSLVALTSVQGGNIELVGNSITSVNTNGPIDLEPNGNGPVTLPATNPLLFYATNGTNYISFQGGGSVVNQTYIWPTTTPTAGQSLGFSGGSTLAWLATPSVPGATTINAIARFSNISGGLKDSPGITLDDAGNLVSLASCVISDIVIGGTGSGQQTITTTTADESLILAPNGLGAVECQGDIWVYPSSGVQRKVRFYTSAGSSGHYAGLIANNSMTTSPIWSLPIAGSLAGVFYTDTSNVMSIKPFFIGPSVIGNVPSFVDTVGTLQDSGTSLFTGPSTVNAIPTFSNITGSLQNSNLTYGSGTMQFGGSVAAIVGPSTFSISSPGQLTISSGAGQNLILLGGLGQNVLCTSSLIINTGGNSTLSIFNNIGFKTTIRTSDFTGANYILSLPTANGAGYMLNDGSGNLSFLALTTVSTNIPQFTNTTGTIGASPISISAGGSLTGVTACTINNINIGTTANTIASTNTNGNINVVPNGTGWVNLSNSTASTSTATGAFVTAGGVGIALKAFIGGALNVTDATASTSTTTGSGIFSGGMGIAGKAFIGGTLNVTDTTDSTTVSTGSGIFSGGVGIAKTVTAGGNIQLINSGTTLSLRLYNSAATFYTGIQSAATGNATFTLPLTLPAATGLIKSDSSGNMTIDSLGATAGVLTTNGSGGVTIATATTVANQLAKYSSTTMSSLTAANSNTGTFLDANNNLSIGTSSIGGSATDSITLFAGNAALSAAAGIVSICNRNTGTGNVLALYGGGDGGLSTSTTNTNTHKISVFINGNRYYLLASTSGT